MSREVVISGGARTPLAEYGGALRDLTETELGAIAARAALERAGVGPEEVDHVVFGNALQSSGNALYGARHVGLKAGLPVAVPALTLNRLCGSGIQSVISAAQWILLGEAETVLAGGMESMSQAPFVVRRARSGLRMGHQELEDSLLTGLQDGFCRTYMAGTAENLARERGIPRAEQDRFAIRSQTAAEAAHRAGRLREEIVPVRVPAGTQGETLVTEDDHRRPETTLEGLSRLPPAFEAGGTVTAGNASGIVDGAAAVVVESAERAAGRGRRPLGRIRAWGIAGVEPRIMGIGPVPATRIALGRAGLRLEEIDLVEVNEAFAAQYLAVERELGLDRDRVNVNGGAIALGHPLGATGTRLILTLLLELRRRAGRYGLASACIGGGQGIAIVLESI